MICFTRVAVFAIANLAVGIVCTTVVVVVVADDNAAEVFAEEARRARSSWLAGIWEDETESEACSD